MKKTIIFLSFLLFIFAGSSWATNFSYTGTFNNDDDVQLFDFTVTSTSNVTLKTYSYAGGTMADNTVISAGGFDPILSYFGSSGFINYNDDGTASEVGTDPTSSEAYDSYLQVSMNPGTYTVAISQYDNFFNGTAGDSINKGFERTGEPTFTGDDAGGSLTGTKFVDADGYVRTNAWAFDILNVATATQIDPSAVPEPATMVLFCIGLLGLVGVNRRNKSSI